MINIGVGLCWYQSNSSGCTALILAACNGFSDIVSGLVDLPRIDFGHVYQVKKSIKLCSNPQYEESLQILLKFPGQRVKDVEKAKLTDTGWHFYRRIFNRLLLRVRFRGLIRAVIAFGCVRLRAAEASYIPGRSGFASAAAGFNNAAGGITIPLTCNSSTLTSHKQCSSTVILTAITDEPTGKNLGIEDDDLWQRLIISNRCE